MKVFGFESCKPISTPMLIGQKLSSKDGMPKVEQMNYRSMIGGLEYLTHTRLDIENATRIVESFKADPKEYHYAVVKRIFRYLKGRTNYRLWYDRSSDFTLYSYTDVDWESNLDD